MEIDTRNHKIKSDYGVNDYYRHFVKHNKDVEVSRAVYGEMIKEFNTYQRDRLATKGAGFVFPNKVGSVELRKIKTEVKIDEEGNIINNLPPNWPATRKLWAENPEAKKAKIKIKFINEHTDGYTFKISYLRSKASYKNKSIYKMSFNRTLKRTLSASIFQGRIDAFVKQY